MDGREAFRNSGSVILRMQVDSAIIAKEQNSFLTTDIPKKCGKYRPFLFVCTEYRE